VSIANPLWGAPRVHGDLLKLGTRTVKQASLYSPMDQGGGKRGPVIATSGHQISTMFGKLSLAI
jgi:hypothetical protein